MSIFTTNRYQPRHYRRPVVDFPEGQLAGPNLIDWAIYRGRRMASLGKTATVAIARKTAKVTGDFLKARRAELYIVAGAITTLAASGGVVEQATAAGKTAANVLEMSADAALANAASTSPEGLINPVQFISSPLALLLGIGLTLRGGHGLLTRRPPAPSLRHVVASDRETWRDQPELPPVGHLYAGTTYYSATRSEGRLQRRRHVPDSPLLDTLDAMFDHYQPPLGERLSPSKGLWFAGLVAKHYYTSVRADRAVRRALRDEQEAVSQERWLNVLLSS